MQDQFNRHIDYLRISVTDRCNLRCHYCMPPEGIRLLRHLDILNFMEIVEVVKVAAEMGVTRIRLTGGEPLVRRGIIELVKMISKVEGIKDLSMTTNGILLSDFAFPLKDAGLHRINVSLDTLDPDKFRKITRGGELKKVLEGLNKAKEAGFSPIKINCVVNELSDTEDEINLQRFSKENSFELRFIRQMDLATGEFYVVEGGDGGKCSACNRLRMTSNGRIKPCLFDAIGYDVRELGARAAILKAVENKPRCGTLNPEGQFYTIGG